MSIASKKELFSLSLALYLLTVPVLSAKENRTFPGAIWTKFNSRLKGFTFRSWETPSQIFCSQSCLSSSRCHSINFKEISSLQRRGLCELNDEHLMDSVGIENNLIHEEGFVFSRFPKDNKVSNTN